VASRRVEPSRGSELPDGRFEAAVVDWDAAVRSARQAELAELRECVERLCSLGFDLVFVSSGRLDDVDRRLGARPAGPGRLLLCLEGGSGLHAVGRNGPQPLDPRLGAGPTDPEAPVLAELWRRGIAPGLVLRVAGAGMPAALAALNDQLRRRRDRELPRIAEDPTWAVAVEGLDPRRERAHESVLSLADGRVGTSGTPLAIHPAATPSVLVSGVYRGEGAQTELLPCPIWNLIAVELPPDASLRRVLDLRTGVQGQRLEVAGEEMTALLFSSLERPGTAVLRASGVPTPAGAGSPLAPPLELREIRASRLGNTVLVEVGEPPAAVSVAAAESWAGPEGATLDRVAVYAPGSSRPRARARLRSARAAGFERLLAGHRARWAARWEDADVELEGDDDLQRAVRLGLFHLMASVATSGEAAVGARGLSGPGYRGHVFWDADVFVLPFLAATHPPAARAMLRYRANRLPAAKAAARALGCEGARFPWESAATGEDVTPTSATDLSGQPIEIRTGELEEHVTADVAWAVSCYLAWTEDRRFARDAGRTLLLETARYWASRARVDAGGRAHIDHVIGPDEYHVDVDDNAFTNVMARWNLCRAAAVPGVQEDERRRFVTLAAALSDGLDTQTGLYEQFAGFFSLEPVVIAKLAPRRPVAAEALLGRERLARAQVVKQADVLMLFHLLPDEVAPGTLEANLNFYEPRTSHGSSLSPGVHAALFARARRLERALDLVRLTASIDLEDLTGTTAAGVHLAAMGSLWQALVFGFLGARPGPRLRLDPVLPREWRALTVRLRVRGTRVRVRVEPGRAVVFAERPLQVAIGAATATAGPAGVTLPLVEGMP
jgi:trehalose/maltose hydrolase-like predicted phosphorylase